MHKILKSIQLAGLLTLIGFATGCVPYNKVILQSGTLAFLKQQSAVNVRYDYEGLQVGTPNHSVTEQWHIDKKVASRNEKTAGTGESWRQEWLGNRTSRYQPKFEAMLNKQAGVTIFGQHPDAPYTLILKIAYLEPGYNVGVSAKPSCLNGDATFIETKSPANNLATLSLVNMMGLDAWGFTYDETYRIDLAYTMAGRQLGAFIKSKAKHKDKIQ